MPCGRASDQIEIFFHISTGNTYTIPIHSLLFLYYVGSPKVPPRRVFGPRGPKTLRGQLFCQFYFRVLVMLLDTGLLLVQYYMKSSEV